MKAGDIVYCEDSQQVFLVMGHTFDRRRLYLKNLTNVDCENLISLPEKCLIPCPTEWKNYSWYETLARRILDGYN